jgi:hypothetical protein
MGTNRERETNAKSKEDITMGSNTSNRELREKKEEEEKANSSRS